MKCDLAQVNVSRLLAPLDSTLLEPFVAALNEVNAEGDRAPGFVWRLQTESGNATDVEGFGWDVAGRHGVIVNLTTWTSTRALSDFVFSGRPPRDHASTTRVVPPRRRGHHRALVGARRSPSQRRGVRGPRSPPATVRTHRRRLHPAPPLPGPGCVDAHHAGRRRPILPRLSFEPSRRGLAKPQGAGPKSSYTSRVDARPNPDLTEIREAINVIDERIAKLIGERQAWVEQAGRLKRNQGEDAVRAPARVDAVISRVRLLAVPAGASPEVVERIYRALIASFVDLELEVHSGESTGP